MPSYELIILICVVISAVTGLILTLGDKLKLIFYRPKIYNIRPVGTVLVEKITEEPRGRVVGIHHQPAVYIYAALDPKNEEIEECKVEINSPEGKKWYAFLDHVQTFMGNIISEENFHIGRVLFETSSRALIKEIPMYTAPRYEIPPGGWRGERYEFGSGIYEFKLIGRVRGKVIQKKSKIEINIKGVLKKAMQRSVWQEDWKKERSDLVDDGIEIIRRTL